MKIVLIGIIFLFILVIGKVFYIQVIDYDKLNDYASNLWSRNLPVKADRGIIYDRDGGVLADNITTTSLVVIPNQIKDKESVKTLTGVNSDITFENVCFEYEENIPVLKNISFSAKRGQTIALVGNSGGGKSTIVNLLPRFYDVKTGSIKIDGIDIKDYSLSSLRSHISEVFQDNFLFSGTIRDNILMGKFDATNEEVEEAIQGAHLNEFLHTLENGADTIIGERGTSLSGGQRQRVAIARAMIKNAPIIILDEATSALDNKSEAIVQKALENLMKDKTVFVIAHRLSTIKNADIILVVNDGQLVEAGSHEELLNIENGQYKYLYEMQFKTACV